jgi:hypothetical protein
MLRVDAKSFAEHVGNVVREETNNPNLSLKDALLTFVNKTDAAHDRIFQKVKQSYVPAQHKPVYNAYVLLVDSANMPHHDLLQEIAMKHPEDVFYNVLQRRSFQALCDLNEVPFTLPDEDAQ